MGKRTDGKRFRVGDFLVQPDRLVIIGTDGRETALEPRVMDVLVELAENAGQTLSAHHLLIAVWEDDDYDDNPVHRAIAMLRRALCDDSRAPRYLETKRKRGYRLFAPVSIPEDYRRGLRTSDAWTGGNPYVGLTPFDKAHACVFFGRTAGIADLLAAMRSQIDNERRLVLVIGSSGCGKTSMVHAGVIPLLTRKRGFDGLHALSIAHCNLAAQHVDSTLTALATALSTWVLGSRTVFSAPSIDDLKNSLSANPDCIRANVEDAFRRHIDRHLDTQPHAHLLLIVDHTEALVSPPGADPEAIKTFSRIIRALCNTPRVIVMIIARSDFYPRLIESLPDLKECKAGDGHQDVLIPREGEIAEIIRKPAILAGLTFEEHPTSLQHLDDKLLRDVSAQPDALPLLQHALYFLYEDRNERNELTFSAYERIGGVEGAIAHIAESVFTALPHEAQATLESVFARLIMMQPGSDTVSGGFARTNELVAEAGPLVEAFIRARLFVGQLSNDDGPTFRVSHEALLRQWPRATQWVRDNRLLLEFHANLKTSVDRWIKDGRRSDHLLNPGTPLIEAVEVMKASGSTLPPLSDDEQDYIARSNRQRVYRLRLRLGAITALVLLSFASAVMAYMAMVSQAESERLTTFMMGEYAEKLDPSGNLHLIESISTEVLTYCQAPRTENELITCSRASRKLGEVRMEQKRLPEAQELIMRSVELSAQAADEHAGSKLALNEAGQALAWLGKLRHRQGDNSSARQAWQRYLDTTERLVAKHGDDPESYLQKSYALTNLGYIESESGNFRRAIDHFSTSIVIKKQVLALVRGEEAAYELIVSASLLSEMHAKTGNLRLAHAGYQSQINALEILTKNRPDAKEWLRQLANLQQLQAAIALDLGEYTQASEGIKRAIDKLDSLSRREPENSSWARFLAHAHLLAADIAIAQSDSASSARHLQSAITVLGAQLSSPVSWQRLDARIRFRQALHRDGGPDRAGMEKAIRSLRRILESNAADRHARLALAESLIAWAEHSPSHSKATLDGLDAHSALSHLLLINGHDREIRIIALKVRAMYALDHASIPCELLSRLSNSGYRILHHPDRADNRASRCIPQ